MELEEQYGMVIDLTLRRCIYGSISGLAAALLVFRSPTKRWSAVAFGAGAGLGSAYADASRILGDRMIFPALPKRPSK
jgi:inner membrane organizing system protein 1